LIFYTAAVWSEHLQKRLLLCHVIIIWLGVTIDTVGTDLMIEHVGYVKFNLHTLTGFIGVGLMIIHAIWATKVILSKRASELISFHKFGTSILYIS
jgi:uncharacterized repeat protein (TIGR03987 family)